MKKEFKDSLLQALSSGEYLQGHNYLISHEALSNRPHYCCLGVAGKLCGLSDDYLESASPDPNSDEYELGTFLDKNTAARIGLSMQDQQTLAEINDNDESGTFEGVIAFIRDNMEETE